MQAFSTSMAGTAPVLRWAGSKRWLVRQGISEIIGSVEGVYHEPFLGSASVFLALETNRAVLSDLNANLINFYRAVQNDSDGVADALEVLPIGKEAYYLVRREFPHRSPSESAAQFLYLNTFGFNGLYRENSRGVFNVPYGRPKNSNVPTRTALRALAERLGQDVELESTRFQLALRKVSSGDTVYLDPPYVAGHRANGFVDYNRHLFRWTDQEDLASEFRRLDRIGARVFLSNADHESVRHLFRGYRITGLTRHSSMAGRKQSRGDTQEILVTNSGLS